MRGDLGDYILDDVTERFVGAYKLVIPSLNMVSCFWCGILNVHLLN